jgi:glycosyltransferase involved in cell wall biosynthesis
MYFVPHPVWPANTGARLRNYHLARQLAASASVTFVEMRRTGEAYNAPPADSGLDRVVTLHKESTYTPIKLARGLAGPLPITVLNCWSSASASLLAEVMCAEEFDTVQIQGVHLMEYLPTIQTARGRPKVLVDWHNIESELMWRYSKTTVNPLKQLIARRTAGLLEHAEERLLRNCDSHIVTSELDRQELLARQSGSNIRVIPNGVDTASYAKSNSNMQKDGDSTQARSSILFVGSMDYHANIDAVSWFTREIWPEIARSNPELHFTIVGRNPPAQVRALADNRIHVTGTVDDVRRFYSSALMAVVPLRSGGGTRLKILEAMAAGTPVISTRLGAEGLVVEHNKDILLADDGPEFLTAVNQLLSSEETHKRITQSARTLVGGVYDWNIIGKQLLEVHKNLVNRYAADSLQQDY